MIVLDPWKLSEAEALKMFLLRAAQNLKLSSTQHRRMAWGVQKGKRRLQAALPVSGPPMKQPWPPLAIRPCYAATVGLFIMLGQRCFGFLSVSTSFFYFIQFPSPFLRFSFSYRDKKGFFPSVPLFNFFHFRIGT
jgi:hypothetical protein